MTSGKDKTTKRERRETNWINGKDEDRRHQSFHDHVNSTCVDTLLHLFTDTHNPNIPTNHQPTVHQSINQYHSNERSRVIVAFQFVFQFVEFVAFTTVV